jgi:predicted RNA binding protein YcfA (HicA-like mRNA interferase family)
MPALPTLRGAEVVKALEKAGFTLARVHGSHHIMKHEDGRRATVPVHGGRDIRPGTLRAILRDTGITVDDLYGLL